MFLLYFMIFLIFQFLPKEIKMIRLSYVCLFFFFFFPKASFLSGKGLFVPKQTQVSFCKCKWLRLGRRAVIPGWEQECAQEWRLTGWLPQLRGWNSCSDALLTFALHSFLGCLGSDPEPVHTQQAAACCPPLLTVGGQPGDSGCPRSLLCGS